MPQLCDHASVSEHQPSPASRLIPPRRFIGDLNSVAGPCAGIIMRLCLHIQALVEIAIVTLKDLMQSPIHYWKF